MMGTSSLALWRGGALLSLGKFVTASTNRVDRNDTRSKKSARFSWEAHSRERQPPYKNTKRPETAM